MTDTDYREPYDLVLDWQEARGRDLTPDECEVAAETEAQLAAYTGRMYGEIRLDIARCAVASLDALQVKEQNNVTPIHQSRAAVYASTEYIATTSVVHG